MAPGMGSEMMRLDLDVDRGLGMMVPLLLAAICCISCMARSGILLGSEHDCCHRGSFCVSISFPCEGESEVRGCRERGVRVQGPAAAPGPGREGSDERTATSGQHD